MKKSLIKLMVILMLSSIMTSCKTRSTSPSDISTNISNSHSNLYSSALSPNDIILPLFDTDTIHTNLLNGRDACRSILENAEQDENGFPTEQQFEQMLQKVANLGIPVCSRQKQSFDMKNFEQIISFFEDMNNNQDCQISIYAISQIDISAKSFLYNNGQIYMYDTYLFFNSKNQDNILSISHVKKLELTKHGHLLYHAIDAEGKDESGGYCVIPHGDDLRQLRQKYIDPVGYMGKILTENWDENNLFNLDWEELYARLYYWRHYSSISTDFPRNEMEDTPIIVPAAFVEPLLQDYFAIRINDLHTLEYYDPEQNAYNWKPTINSSLSFLVPEVIESQENKDGSLTLTVGALDLENGKEYICISKLTVVPKTGNHFTYISNRTNCNNISAQD